MEYNKGFDERIINNLKSLLGDNFNLSINEEEIKKIYNEKEIFVNILKNWENIWKRSIKLSDKYGIDTVGYDENYLIIIENLIFMQYGYNKSQVIYWWVYQRSMSEEPAFIINEKNNKKYKVNTPLQLWNFLQEY